MCDGLNIKDKNKLGNIDKRSNRHETMKNTI